MIDVLLLLRSRFGSLDRKIGPLVPLLAGLLLNGCSTYYGQLLDGQVRLLRAREPVSQVVADPARDARLREQLRQSQAARDFASSHLHLPDNRSYRLYADVKRSSVVWNVFATPEFSLDPQTHCFPIAGCVAYRGYYSLSGARGEAALQKQAGMDVYIGGVDAYSTLGWFDDPIINTMMDRGDERLATLIFHELAHQRFYVQNDTEFNESYATFVEQEGTRQWRAYQGLPPADQDMAKQVHQFTQLVLDTREQLKSIYAQPLAPAAMRQAKQQAFERMRAQYRQLRDRQWGGDKRYDAWVNAPMNNAKLLPFGLYDQWVPSFAALFSQVHGDWPSFFKAVERLGKLPADQRKAALVKLASR